MISQTTHGLSLFVQVNLHTRRLQGNQFTTDPMTHPPAFDPRWPFPVATICLHSMILIPSVAILAMYAPIMASIVSNDNRHYREGLPFVFACCALSFSATSTLYIICSFGMMIYSCLSPMVVKVLSSISTLLWGAAIGLSSVFWQKKSALVCGGDLGPAWRCEYKWITTLCATVAAGSSLLLVLMCWYTMLKHLGRYPNNNRKLKQASTSIVRLGPPSTPPVNLTNSRISGQNDIDSLLEQGSISEITERPLRLYDNTQSAEFHAAGGAGKLILPQQLDPTSSGFIPGRLLYGPAIPESSSADRKGKAKQRQNASKLPDSGQTNKRRSLFSERLGEDSHSHSNRNSQTFVGSSVTITRKPLPALPVRSMDTGALSVGPSSYYLPPPQQASFVRQHHVGRFSSNFERIDLLPPPIPPKHPLRRISSAPPGSLDLRPMPPNLEADYYGYMRSETVLKPPRPITDSPANWRYESLPKLDIPKSVLTGPCVPPSIGTKVDMYPWIQAGNEPVTKIAAGSAASGSKVGVSPHTPRKPSNLTLSFTPTDLDTSGVDRECEGQRVSAPSEENSWVSGPEELLYRADYDFHCPSDSLNMSPVISSDTPTQSSVPTAVDSTITTSEEPNIGPVKHQDTFSSEESDESLGLDPEKMELAEKVIANQQAVAVPQFQHAQEMTEVPESPSLTLPMRGLARMRSVSSPIPVPIPSAHPVLQLSRGIDSGTTSQPHPMQSPMNSRNRIVSDTSFNHHRYTRIAPLTVRKALPPLPKLPPLKVTTPHSSGGTSSSLVPPTPRSLRTPFADLKTQCVGHFTVSPTGEVEMSTQVPVGGSSPYRGRIESVSSTNLAVGWEGSHSTDRPDSSALETNARLAENSLGLTQQLPVTRKRSKSGPPATTVRFELSRNEVFEGRTWATSSSGEGSK